MLEEVKELKDRKVLITGGSGFIGSHLVEALKDICDVTVLSFSKKAKSSRTINADLRKEKDIADALKDLDIEIVFHLAANVAIKKESVENLFEVNAIGTRNLLEVCRKKDIDRFVYSSSMAVFGKPLYLPVDEKHPKLPRSAYGMSKLLGEIYCNEYARFYGMKTVILRYSHVFGPRQSEAWVVSIFIKNALTNKPLQVYGSGKSSGDFVYVGDVVNANILAAIKTKAIGEDFNIGSGKETTIEELAHKIKKLTKKGEIVYVPEKEKEIERFVFDISKAKRLIGYNPRCTLEKGLMEQIKHTNS